MLVGSTAICVQRDKWTRGEARHQTRPGLNLGSAENAKTVSVVSEIHTWQCNSFISKVHISYIWNFGHRKKYRVCKLLLGIGAESDVHSVYGVCSKFIFTPLSSKSSGGTKVRKPAMRQWAAAMRQRGNGAMRQCGNAAKLIFMRNRKCWCHCKFLGSVSVRTRQRYFALFFNVLL